MLHLKRERNSKCATKTFEKLAERFFKTLSCVVSGKRNNL